jgi:2-octaprenyl-6-methoxyphenol hydroxylase
MTNISAKALVAGGGPAGLAAACLLAHVGVDTVCVAPEVPDDPRTTALMAPSIRMLESLGVWTDDLRQHCAPLKQLHLLDDTGNLMSAPDLRFSAEEVGLDAFGWNVPLNMLVPALRGRAETLGTRFILDEIADVTTHGGSVSAMTKGGKTITATFAVAADGRNSLLRKAAGIHASAWSFNQSALVARFAHSHSHAFVSTEWHKLGGPFTTVPLLGNHSALVWMDKPERINALLELDSKDLARDIQLQCHGTLGLVSDVSKPYAFAMRGVKADRFAAQRTYLVGEAAHVFPPVGAQGLNMSLRDVGHMVDVATAHDDPGSDAAMAEYDAKRRADVVPRQTAISAMNQSLLADMLPLHLARAAGLMAVAWLPPLREFAMREGLSPSGGLPFAMR